ncbi:MULTISPECIES: GNAT family N-acetyltransferase [unclassified Pseudomonas]|uniref:GNAT family N-acetyltransferase n=1 Tax=unclassified Pseudomonas TaxID=196821 RepID=UPI001313E78D|nr:MULTISPECIES: GNAT family N-acetyltransferase [unclassified Pseudomonas]MDW3710434.1 GNAT family N-acetyltransferase [Pseudomonas sp. 2023EL-01195]
MSSTPSITLHTAPVDSDLDFVFTFERRQEVERVIRMQAAHAVESADPFIDDWSPAERQEVKDTLRVALANGGLVCLATRMGRVVGFACVDGAPVEPTGRYRPLKELHVEASVRGRGIGRLLFACCLEEARRKGFQRLYVSSHSARETVLFYRRQGCVDAQWLWPEQAEREPFDYPMECEVGR